MDPAQRTFVETFAAFIVGTLLSFVLGRCSRDKEVERLQEKAAKEMGAALRAESQLVIRNSKLVAANLEVARSHDQIAQLIARAEAAEAKLPRRGAHGKFTAK